MIIWIASYPRSGNTMFRMLLKHRFGVRTYSVYDDPRLDHEGIAGVIGHAPMPTSVEQMDASPLPYFVKTHELPDEHQGPAVYLVRDGRDAAVSHARYLQSFAPPATSWRQRLATLRQGGVYRSALDRVVEGRTHFGKWSDHVRAWQDRDAPTVTLRYEDLIDNPIAWVDRALEAVGATLPVRNDSPMPSFAQLNEKSPDFFRKGEAGGWRSEMPGKAQERFWELHGTTMELVGYTKQGDRPTLTPIHVEAGATAPVRLRRAA